MSSVPFHYLDVRTFCYETEDEARVESAIRALLPAECELDRDVTAGHHGDRIVVLSTRLEQADAVRHVLGVVEEADAVDTILAEVADRIDEDCSFFVRFDKQAATRGEVAVGAGIQLRGKVEAYPANREAAIENLRGYFADDQ